MAFNSKDYEKLTYKARGKVIELPNLFQTKEEISTKGKRFVGRFKFEDKIYTKTLGYSKKDNLTPRSANIILDNYKRDIEAGYTSSSNINLDKLFEFYYETLDTTKKWTVKKRYIYNLYIKEVIGNKQIDKIREMDIKKVINIMSKKGLSPRTQKTVLEITKPLFQFATKNKYLKDNPSKDINIKIPNQKKIVTGATELFNQVYHGITTFYKDEPFYQALFLFGFTGRRKTEILTLKWENIDFTNNYYWIEDTKNADKQKYQLADFIKIQLLQIKDTHRGLVFKSPTTGKQISNIDRQMRNLIKHLAFMYCNNNPLYQAYTVLKTKEKTKDFISNLKWTDKLTNDLKDILSRYKGAKSTFIFEHLELEKFDKLSPHYMRNILVSMLAEQNTEAITLSAILGHKDVNTINKYLSINHFKGSQEDIKRIDNILDVEVVEWI